MVCCVWVVWLLGLLLQPVLLKLYLGDKLVDQTLLSHHAMKDLILRDAYVQGAMKALLERWDDLIEDQRLKPQFYIQTKL
jgi:hypothetical protein